ncbi:uncharacterized protein METZ01_LOCUS358817, partial [marine metagenome]
PFEKGLSQIGAQRERKFPCGRPGHTKKEK